MRHSSAVILEKVIADNPAKSKQIFCFSCSHTKYTVVNPEEALCFLIQNAL